MYRHEKTLPQKYRNNESQDIRLKQSNELHVESTLVAHNNKHIVKSTLKLIYINHESLAESVSY